MTNRLVIHFPKSCISIESDNKDNVLKLSTILIDEFDAYHSTESIDELTVDHELTQEMSNKLHSLMFELGLY